MIAIDQTTVAAQIMLASMAEGQVALPQSQRFHNRLMADMAERQDDPPVWHRRQLRFEKGPAVIELFGQRLVLWRNAARCIGDPAINQGEAVIRRLRIDACGKAEFCQGRVERVAGIIAREGPARSIGAA